MKYFIYTVIVIVGIAIVAGFFMIGSPGQERARRFDAQRVQDLQTIQWQIGDFYHAKNRLPQTLSELNDSFRGIIIPKDPENGNDYEYHVKVPTSFTLCTTFNLPSVQENINSLPKAVPDTFFVGDQTWNHGAELTCFDRTIDKDFFKPLK